MKAVVRKRKKYKGIHFKNKRSAADVRFENRMYERAMEAANLEAQRLCGGSCAFK